MLVFWLIREILKTKIATVEYFVQRVAIILISPFKNF